MPVPRAGLLQSRRALTVFKGDCVARVTVSVRLKTVIP